MMTDEKLKQEQADEEMINQAFQHLLDSYLTSKHRRKVEIITKAFNFAKQAHKGVKRRSGEPYIMHPIAVAQIACSEIGLGSTSICAALLHDVVEDTDYTVEDILLHKAERGRIIKDAERESLQGKIALIEKIETISNHGKYDTQADITSVRETRSKEKKRCHKGEF